MLKLSADEDERLGGVLMQWWRGDGAARVLARDDGAILLERDIRAASLLAMCRTGNDEEACRILCTVAARLHAPRQAPTPELVPLSRWFRALEPAAAAHGGDLARCAEIARLLLAEPLEPSVLHGDLHHGNVLDFGERGWLAIDPKGLAGERGFDFANIFLNPDLSDSDPSVATRPDLFRRRLKVVSAAARLYRQRLLRWILAWAGLSAAWLLSDGQEAPVNRRIAELAIAELDQL